jgi:hypothetical protein
MTRRFFIVFCGVSVSVVCECECSVKAQCTFEGKFLEGAPRMSVVREERVGCERDS